MHWCNIAKNYVRLPRPNKVRRKTPRSPMCASHLLSGDAAKPPLLEPKVLDAEVSWGCCRLFRDQPKLLEGEADGDKAVAVFILLANGTLTPPPSDSAASIAAAPVEFDLRRRCPDCDWAAEPPMPSLDLSAAVIFVGPPSPPSDVDPVFGLSTGRAIQESSGCVISRCVV